VVTCKAAHVVGGEDAGGRIVLMLSSHTFLGMGFQRGCVSPALSVDNRVQRADAARDTGDLAHCDGMRSLRVPLRPVSFKRDKAVGNDRCLEDQDRRAPAPRGHGPRSRRRR
jgi:hypothetical protein